MEENLFLLSIFLPCKPSLIRKIMGIEYSMQGRINCTRCLCSQLGKLVSYSNTPLTYNFACGMIATLCCGLRDRAGPSGNWKTENLSFFEILLLR
jgi:hypothetical protein